MIDGEDDYLQEPVTLHDVELVPRSPATVPNESNHFLDSIPLGVSQTINSDERSLLPNGIQVQQVLE